MHSKRNAKNPTTSPHPTQQHSVECHVDNPVGAYPCGRPKSATRGKTKNKEFAKNFYKTKLNLLPSPATLSTFNCVPCFSSNSRQTINPNPVPVSPAVPFVL